VATFAISFDTGAVPLSRIQDAFGRRYNYTGFAPDGGAETKAQFVRRVLKRHIIDVVLADDREQGRAAADAAVTEITLT
jgi:hypothetical protein